jgi:putative membrane protein
VLKLIKLLLVVLVMMLGAAFTVMNADPVKINYYFGTGEWPLAIIVVASLLLGALLGAMSGVGAMLRQRNEVGRLRRQQKVAKQEIENLRTLPMKD